MRVTPYFVDVFMDRPLCVIFLEISRSALVNSEYLSLYDPKDHTIIFSSGQHLILSKHKQSLMNAYFKGLHDHRGYIEVSFAVLLDSFSQL